MTEEKDIPEGVDCSTCEVCCSGIPPVCITDDIYCETDPKT